jgi:nitrogen regulatory protein PII
VQLIEAIIKPNKLEAVKNAITKLGVLGMTALECKGFGRQLGHSERYRGPKMDAGFVPKLLLHIVVADKDKDNVVKAIVEAAHTGNVGDGKVFVIPVGEVTRIRTGETAENAL